MLIFCLQTRKYVKIISKGYLLPAKNQKTYIESINGSKKTEQTTTSSKVFDYIWKGYNLYHLYYPTRKRTEVTNQLFWYRCRRFIQEIGTKN